LNEERNVTIISATHDLKMLDVSDRIVYIRDGDVAKIDTRAELDLNVGSSDLGEHH
jgi:putative ABC transport system ATP-binding protein